jgi:hypothetical protein
MIDVNFSYVGESIVFFQSFVVLIVPAFTIFSTDIIVTIMLIADVIRIIVVAVLHSYVNMVYD